MASKVTNEKLQSLRIDRERKSPRNGNGMAVVFLIVGIVLGVGATTVLRGRNGKDEKPATAPAVAAPGATTSTATVAKAEPSTGSVVLTASGYVTPRRRVSLSPKVIGKVAWVGIEKGDRVTSGQVLVKLEDRDYQARRAEAAAQVSVAEARVRELQNGARPEERNKARAELNQFMASFRNFERLLQRRIELGEKGGAISKEDVDDARANREVAEARLESAKQSLALIEAGTRQEQIEAAKANLEAAKAQYDVAEINVEDTIIRAPSDGTILEKLIEVGELVSPQNFGGTRGARTELLSLADLSDLQVEVDVNEADFGKVSMGQAAQVVLDAYPDKTYDAKIREIAPEANRQKATVQVKVKILNPDKFVLPEMSARVDLLK
ncbi:MAG: efflux RND transporter periplasmic adaptor subunit [Candidatus Sumerlaeaceae bacterium]|nr:efflux RND transporter periplasmic adaptor subunit [Candidatus Sumerlaeaceae bacterium]